MKNLWEKLREGIVIAGLIGTLAGYSGGIYSMIKEDEMLQKTPELKTAYALEKRAENLNRRIENCGSAQLCEALYRDYDVTKNKYDLFISEKNLIESASQRKMYNNGILLSVLIAVFSSMLIGIGTGIENGT